MRYCAAESQRSNVAPESDLIPSRALPGGKSSMAKKKTNVTDGRTDRHLPPPPLLDVIVRRHRVGRRRWIGRSVGQPTRSDLRRLK